MAWNVFKIDSSKIGFYQNFLIYCDKFDNKIIYCLARFRAGNFSPAPTSRPGWHNTSYLHKLGVRLKLDTMTDSNLVSWKTKSDKILVTGH